MNQKQKDALAKGYRTEIDRLTREVTQLELSIRMIRVSIGSDTYSSYYDTAVQQIADLRAKIVTKKRLIKYNQLHLSEVS